MGTEAYSISNSRSPSTSRVSFQQSLAEAISAPNISAQNLHPDAWLWGNNMPTRSTRPHQGSSWENRRVGNLCGRGDAFVPRFVRCSAAALRHSARQGREREDACGPVNWVALFSEAEARDLRNTCCEACWWSTC
ncbi:hypothetical protein HBH47_046630 [Parastagonospora nodorum]|nr:hypothetical protein HBH47_046630 [Parastagonospora nodorum]